jgi:hypothetical protein
LTVIIFSLFSRSCLIISNIKVWKMIKHFVNIIWDEKWLISAHPFHGKVMLWSGFLGHSHSLKRALITRGGPGPWSYPWTKLAGLGFSLTYKNLEL